MSIQVIYNNIRINQILQTTFQWYIHYLNTVDCKNIESYSTFIADNCIMQSNNNPSIDDKEQILKHISAFWKTYKKVIHELLNIYGTDSSFVLEALNHFVLNNGKKTTVRAVAFTDRNSKGLVNSIRLYADLPKSVNNKDTS